MRAALIIIAELLYLFRFWPRMPYPDSMPLIHIFLNEWVPLTAAVVALIATLVRLRVVAVMAFTLVGYFFVEDVALLLARGDGDSLWRFFTFRGYGILYLLGLGIAVVGLTLMWGDITARITAKRAAPRAAAAPIPGPPSPPVPPVPTLPETPQPEGPPSETP